MSEAKPICVVKYDYHRFYSSGQLIPATVLMDNMQKMMPDYYVFAVPIQCDEPLTEVWSFQVFYEKDFTEIQYAELRQLIEKSIKP